MLPFLHRYPDDEMGRKEAKHRAAVSESKDKARCVIDMR
jgi:hypothetical protein